MNHNVANLTNWSSRSLHVGPIYSIMRKPRHWEHGAGTVRALVPSAEDLEAVRAGRIDVATYRDRFLADIDVEALEPGRLRVATYVAGRGFEGGHPVGNVFTACCACSRETAARGECHRAWCAPLLVAAGWRVVLDGREVTP